MHIEKLENACREIAAAGHYVFGILGYIKASTAILTAARTTDLVLWHFTDDIVHFTEETAGPSLATRLHDWAAKVTTAGV